MAETSKIWPDWDEQKHCLHFLCTHITRLQYDRLRKYFTKKQFQKVEEILGAPEGYNLLDKLRVASYYYMDWKAQGDQAKSIRRMRKPKREVRLSRWIKMTEQLLDLLDSYSSEITDLYSRPLPNSPKERERNLQDYIRFEELKERIVSLQESLRYNYKRLEIKRGRKHNDWDVFLWAIAVIYEKVRGKRPTIPRRIDSFSHKGTYSPPPYGPFLLFARESLKLIGAKVSDEQLVHGLRRYRASGQKHVEDNSIWFDYFR